MRIGVMLRAYDEMGGIGVYTRNIVRELLALDRHNHYVLFYQRADHVGQFADYDNVTERVIPGMNRIVWDQIAMPVACWREKIDLIFHPKFTVPLLAPCRAVMVVHGADWLIPEQAQFYSRFNVLAMRVTLPLYFHKCTNVISVSQLTTKNFNRMLRLPRNKVRTIYFGPARHFRRVTDREQLCAVRERYRLPDRFILTLTKPQGEDRKNLGNLLAAYAGYHQSVDAPHKLVIGGRDCEQFRTIFGIPAKGYGRDILFPGWLEQRDLPAIYTLADLFLYPSNLEAFPIPVTEAMACGTPIITSDANGLREIADDAALLVNPGDVDAIADAIGRLLSDADLRAVLSARGLDRARRFTWEACVRQTLAVLERREPQSDRGKPW